MPVDAERLKRVLDHKLVTMRHLEEENASLRAELASAHQRIIELEADNEKQRQRVMTWVNAAHANEEWDE